MKKLTIVCLAIFISSFSLIGQDQESVEKVQGQTLTVLVENISSTEGNIQVGLYDSEDNWLGRTIMGEVAEINNGQAKVIFENVPSGDYAISLYHDENSNKKLDTGWFGIPKEPYACSRGAVGRFGPPKWNDAVFSIGIEAVNQTIKL